MAKTTTKTAARKAEVAEAKGPYEPTRREQEATEAIDARWRKTAPSPRIKVIGKTDTGIPRIGLDHPDQEVGGMLLLGALGSVEPDFLHGVMGQLVNIGTQGKGVDENGVNFALAVVKGIEPRDQVEAMLAMQMAAVHNATMTLARRFAHTETIPQQDSAGRVFNQLARTFAVQAETLKRYRSKGEQRVVVQHQHVNVTADRAAVQVNAAGPGGAGTAIEMEDQPHAQPDLVALAHAPVAPLLCPDTPGEPVPVASGGGEGPVSDARRG